VKRWEKICGIIGALFLFAGALAIHRGTRDIARQDLLITSEGCRTPVSVLEKAGAESRGSVVVLHGLCANRKIMFPFSYQLARAGMRVYTVDSPGHGENTDAYSFARVEQCVAAAVEYLTDSGKIKPDTTAVIGHSMGGAAAVRLADRDPVAATIAISPGPMVMPQRMPSNLLVFSAGHDLNLLKHQATRLAAAAGGGRRAPGDFTERRAFDLVYQPHATHTSLLLDSSVLQDSIRWAQRAFSPSPSEGASGGDVAGLTPRDAAFGGSLLGLIGLFMLFPACATIVTSFARPKRAEIDDPRPSRLLALAEGAICSVFGVLILSQGMPLKFLHMYTGSYLASFLFLIGVLFISLNWKDALESLSPNFRRGVATALLGFVTILAIGAWLDWHLSDAWLNGPRWLRFAGLFPFLWVYSYGEEVMLGPVRIGWRRAARYLVFLVLRLELWAACAVAAYRIPNGQLILVVLFMFLAQFSILQRLATDALRLRTGSAPAAATFGAILACWFIASVFPLA
jgi:pimeloyl-ACP methyl ester carboxylesterase